MASGYASQSWNRNCSANFRQLCCGLQQLAMSLINSRNNWTLRNLDHSHEKERTQSRKKVLDEELTRLTAAWLKTAIPRGTTGDELVERPRLTSQEQTSHYQSEDVGVSGR